MSVTNRTSHSVAAFSSIELRQDPPTIIFIINIINIIEEI
ncbi:hypothetical protein FORC31_p254 (plasmid) [Escherichia coli]|nr:hypothetical protein FORC31_p254 [Escherichia coli]